MQKCPHLSLTVSQLKILIIEKMHRVLKKNNFTFMLLDQSFTQTVLVPSELENRWEQDDKPLSKSFLNWMAD